MKLLLTVQTIFLLTAFHSTAQTKADKIQELFMRYHELDKFQGAVLVAVGDSIIYQEAFGDANMELQAPNTVDTKFRISSMTKGFTSILVLQLVERDLLILNGKITDYLPYYRKDVGDKVTILDLVKHTSGIPNLSEYPDFRFDEIRNPHPVDSLVVKWCSNDLEFEPGSKRKYCNSGYIILGAIIEKVTGKTYQEVLQENILTPAGMENSGLADERKVIEKMASGYRLTKNGYVKEPVTHLANLHATGQMYSTVGDLWKFDKALYTDLLLSKQMTDILFTPDSNNWSIAGRVPKRLYPNQTDSVTTTWGGGGYEGFHSFSQRFFEPKIFLTFLNNTDNMKFPRDLRGIISDGIINILFDLPYELPVQKQPISMTETDFKKFVGSYLGEDGKERTIVLEAGKFIYINPEGRKYVIHPESDNTFFFSIQHLMTVTFNGSAAIEKMTVHTTKGNTDYNRQ
ncbi:beta-lactamase family protein [bacterium AH-315-C07]|nr:beta-lactamase family protein [bacterium AH-315-C07]